MPYFEHSRSMPLSLAPPNGAVSVEMIPVDVDAAVFEHFGNAPDAADVAAARRAPGAPTFLGAPQTKEQLIGCAL